MEKLQAAIQNARQKRGEQPTAPEVRKRASSTSRVVEGDGLWTSLRSFEPSMLALETHLIVTQEASEAATPFDILRTKVLLQMQQNNWTRLAITSPMPRSGKTTTACNLALGLGRQHGLRSMLFDLDLRDPSVHEFFDHKPDHSIGKMLTGEVPFAEQGLRIGENLAVSMANQAESDPTRILLSENTSEALDEIQAAYKPDVMIFDLPSVLTGDDTRAFLKNVDCALIVSRAYTTRYSQFDKSEREIAEHTNVLGVVLNACRYTGSAADYD